MLLSVCLLAVSCLSVALAQSPVVVWVEGNSGKAKAEKQRANKSEPTKKQRIQRFPSVEWMDEAAEQRHRGNKTAQRLPVVTPVPPVVQAGTRSAKKAPEMARTLPKPKQASLHQSPLPARRKSPPAPTRAASNRQIKAPANVAPAQPPTPNSERLQVVRARTRALPPVEPKPAPRQQIQPKKKQYIEQQTVAAAKRPPMKVASYAKPTPSKVVTPLPKEPMPTPATSPLPSQGIVFHPPKLNVDSSGELVLSPHLSGQTLTATKASTAIVQPKPQPTVVPTAVKPSSVVGKVVSTRPGSVPQAESVVADSVVADSVVAIEGATMDVSSVVLGSGVGGDIHVDSGYTDLGLGNSCQGCSGSCAPGACSCPVEVNPMLRRVGCCMANRIFGKCGCKPIYQEAGLGHEWMSRSPFVIQRADPMNHYGFRFAAAYDHQYPDRSEFLWNRSPGGGPNVGVGEESVDYQDFRFTFETGGPRFSVATEIPIRVLDPELNLNTAGLGDMSVTTRTVLLDGRDWQITQVFNSYFNTGSATHGTGNGHISLEPGMLVRWEYSDFTHVHAEIKYLFPLGADPDHAGEVLRYGLGFSKLCYDGDAFGMISTLEFVSGTFLDGAQTPPGGVVPEEVDGIGFLNIHPGARFVFDSPGDWGVWDLGVSGGFAVTGSRMYDGIFMMDLRWAF